MKKSVEVVDIFRDMSVEGRTWSSAVRVLCWFSERAAWSSGEEAREAIEKVGRAEEGGKRESAGDDSDAACGKDEDEEDEDEGDGGSSPLMSSSTFSPSPIPSFPLIPFFPTISSSLLLTR